jgi:hypothetical protein
MGVKKEARNQIMKKGGRTVVCNILYKISGTIYRVVPVTNKYSK